MGAEQGSTGDSATGRAQPCGGTDGACGAASTPGSDTTPTPDTTSEQLLAAVPELYQYCWSLVGPGAIATTGSPSTRLTGACAAVWTALLTATERLSERTDHANTPPLRVWLFALARAACQRSGWIRSSPYAALSITDAEAAPAAVLGSLPPSQRELLELALRHGLSPGQTALVTGLDRTTVARLTEAAISRCRDIIAAEAPELLETDRSLSPRRLADVLAEMPPPHPPQKLTALVRHGCTAPEQATARQAAVQRLGPYDVGVWPRHVGAAHDPDEARWAAPSPVGTDTDGSVDPHDRLAGPEAAGPVHVDVAPSHTGPGVSRRHWLLPAVAGLCTVIVALAVWGAAAYLGGPRVVAGPPLDLPAASTPAGDTGGPTGAEAAPTPPGPSAAHPGGRADTAPSATGDPPAPEESPDPAPVPPAEDTADSGASAAAPEQAPDDTGGSGASTEDPSPSAPPHTPPGEDSDGDGDDNGEDPNGDDGGRGGLLSEVTDALDKLLGRS
ncbi:hypothetical protein RIF23_17240 [Lipingzhangella sp. LS1_29]|uniref:DNA-directed RNA polymerase specialized sigma24 family protein n=1 Tax=Lipingzhangella rawalii TaxID=2055835 RepID=A0ABU2H9P7_9ACTN|nr:hypothetical protein [Lipingzhangella rawalii]MDS1272037.1 hypothetical protein [Lipingzhangella rawalii]